MIKIWVDEEYGYREYVVLVKNLELKEFLGFCKGMNAESFFFHSFGLFKALTTKFPQVEYSFLGIDFGEHPLFGRGGFMVKDEHATDDLKFAEDVSMHSHPGFFEPMPKRFPIYMHMHMNDDSFIRVGEERFSFSKEESPPD